MLNSHLLYKQGLIMTVKTYFLQFTLVTLTSALSACGGSSSNGTEVPSEKVEPSVVSVSPVDGSDNVSRSASIMAAFDEALFALSVDDSSFTLSDGNRAVAMPPLLDSETGRTVSLTGSNLRNLTAYTATLTTDITDLAGNALTEPYSWGFTTEDGQWSTAQNIETVAENASFPQIATDPSGNAIAVWMQEFEGQSRIWTNRYNKETDNWTTASLIENTVAEGSAQFPQIAMDKNGNGLVVWKQNQGFNYSIWSSYYNFSDSTWSDAQLIGIVDEASVAYSEVVFDNQGNAIAVWNQTDGDENSIWANRYSAINNSWGIAEAIEQTIDDTYEPKIAIDNNGNALVIWHQRDGAVKSIWANRYSAINNSWGTPVVIETGDGDARLADGVSNAQIAIDTAGNGIAVWSQNDGTEDSIWVNRYDFATTSWGAASLIENDAGYARAPKVAMDSHGNAMVLWYQDNGVVDTTRFNRYSVITNSWGTASEIEAGAGHAYEQQIAFDASNNALAVWKQADGGVFSIRVIRYEAASNSWGASMKIESDSGQVDYPQFSIDGFGNAWAIWQQDDSALSGTQNSIMVNHFE